MTARPPQRRPLSGQRPPWNDLQQDHSKYRLTDDEVRRRHEERAPRPVSSQPLLGDRHLTISRPKATERIDQIRSTIKSEEYTPTHLNTTFIPDAPDAPTVENIDALPVVSLKSLGLDPEPEMESDPKPGRITTLEEVTMMHTLLQRLNRVTEQVQALTTRLEETEAITRSLAAENETLRGELEEMRQEVRQCRIAASGQEYSAMDEVLERLRLL